MSLSKTALDWIIRHAAADPAQSLARARQVDDPWFRCLALAWVARFGPADTCMAIAREALAAAAEGPDLYRAVRASAWPVRALVERGQTAGVAAVLARLVRTAAAIPHPVCRVDALRLLFEAVYPLGSHDRRRVQTALVEACGEESSWRAGRTFRDVALLVAADDPAEAERMVESFRPGRHRRQAARLLAAGERRPPRRFFW